MLYNYKGKEYNETQLTELAKKKYNVTITIAALDARLKRGWEVEKAIKIPVAKRVKKASPERAKENLRRAQEKYSKKNRSKMYGYQTKSYARTFIRKYANLQDLDEFEEKINAKLAELGGDK